MNTMPKPGTTWRLVGRGAAVLALMTTLASLPVLAGGCGTCDDDGDGLSNAQEEQYGTNPADRDTDRDSLTDYEELSVYGTEPRHPDIDGDDVWDPDELFSTFTDPYNPDSDRDGLADGWEIQVLGTDPNNPDTDGDGLGDPCDDDLVTPAGRSKSLGCLSNG